MMKMMKMPGLRMIYPFYPLSSIYPFFLPLLPELRFEEVVLKC